MIPPNRFLLSPLCSSFPGGVCLRAKRRNLLDHSPARSSFQLSTEDCLSEERPARNHLARRIAAGRPLRSRRARPRRARGFLFLSVHRGAPKREPRRSYRGRELKGGVSETLKSAKGCCSYEGSAS